MYLRSRHGISLAQRQIDGCNKMSCNRCNANFCYLCGELIAHANPYDHFKSSKTCAGLLFRGIIDEAPEDEWW